MDPLERMFQVLVRTVRSKHPQLLSAPFTVADLYQQIMPYRHFRRELGLETNQEYELILMELLAGARGFLDVDERLRDQLGKELASGSPEPSRVREYADAHVSINGAAQAQVSDAGPLPTSRTPSTPVSSLLRWHAAGGTRDELLPSLRPELAGTELPSLRRGGRGRMEVLCGVWQGGSLSPYDGS
jgi:hypothetical protein